MANKGADKNGLFFLSNSRGFGGPAIPNAPDRPKEYKLGPYDLEAGNCQPGQMVKRR